MIHFENLSENNVSLGFRLGRELSHTSRNACALLCLYPTFCHFLTQQDVIKLFANMKVKLIKHDRNSGAKKINLEGK